MGTIGISCVNFPLERWQTCHSQCAVIYIRIYIYCICVWERFHPWRLLFTENAASLFVLILASNYFNLCMKRCPHVDSLDTIAVIPMVSERTLVELGDNWDNDDCAQYIWLISIRGSLFNPFKTKCSWQQGHLSWVNSVVSTLINILTKMAHNVLLYFDFLLP